MYTKNERTLMKAMMRRMKKKELIMAIEELIDTTEDQSETIKKLVDTINKLRHSETEVEVPKEKAWKSKD